MMIPDTPIEVPISFVDVRAGIRHDARIARAEGFPMVADRAEDLLRRLEEADARALAMGVPYGVSIVFRPTV